MTEKLHWYETEYIDRIEILDSGELFLGIEGEGKGMYQHVYREAAGVYWEPTLKGFKSTELKNWTPSQWFFHIVAIVRVGVGVNLILGESVDWKGILDGEKAVILETTDADKKKVASTVFWLTLLFATLGLATQLAIVLLIGFGSRASEYAYQIIAAVVGTYICAVAGGVIGGRLISRLGTNGGFFWITGILTAWLCLFFSTLAGSSVEYLRAINVHDAFGDFIVKPMFWFLFLGTIPAILFGIAYAASVRYLLNRRPS